jgi:hypothetical protein
MKKLIMLLSLLSMGVVTSVYAHGGRDISVHLKQNENDSDGTFDVTIKPVRSVSDLKELHNDEGTQITGDQPQVVSLTKNKVRICVRYKNKKEGHIGGRSFVREVDPSTTELHLDPKIEKPEADQKRNMIVVDIEEKAEKAITLSSIVAMLLSYLG